MDENEKLYEQNIYYDWTSAPYTCLVVPWWVREKKEVYFPKHNCIVEPLICGEKLFGRLKEDIENAKYSVNIITWGFDPGMYLIRSLNKKDSFRYGNLLKEIAMRKDSPVKVNLLVWHDDLLSQVKMNNIPGYYGSRFPAVGSYAKKGFYDPEHQEFNAHWFDDVNAGRCGDIEFRTRFVSLEFLNPSLAGEKRPHGLKNKMSASYATHHQKMVLIDYEDPSISVGYVMGHNSITDFWDTDKHIFQDSRRERFYNYEASEIFQEALKRESSVMSPMESGNSGSFLEKGIRFEKYIKERSYITKPYQDVSCRVRGPIIFDMNHNFCQAWMEGVRPSGIFFELLGVTMRPVTNTMIGRAYGKATFYKDKEHWIEKRKAISWQSFILNEGFHSAQLLRTQPEQGEKSIKECYANLTRQMHHYIFIQNQYIQYDTWADYFVKCVERLRNAKFLKPIYVFILTSTPEDTGMDLSTYGVVSKLGKSGSMTFEYDQDLQKAAKGSNKLKSILDKMESCKINVLIGSMWTCDKTKGKIPLKESEYEEIYIHSKVAIVDDAHLQ